MHKLWHPYDHTLEEEQRRRARVQRLRTILQTSRRQQAADDEKRRHTDQEEKTEKATFVVVLVLHRLVQLGEQQTVLFGDHRSTKYIILYIIYCTASEAAVKRWLWDLKKATRYTRAFDRNNKARRLGLVEVCS